MISPHEIKAKTERKYLPFLQSLLRELPFSRIVIRGEKRYSQSLSDFEIEILALINHSKEKIGFGYSLDYQTVKTKTIGTQSLPTSIYFDTEKDLLRYLGKEQEVKTFRQNAEKIRRAYPELSDWMIHSPLRIIQHAAEWDNLLKVCDYFVTHPQPRLYLRELPIPVHTKFIEQHQSILKELLDILIAPFVDKQASGFERRFNLKYREPQVRFRILDKNISLQYFSGLDDIAIPLSQFESLKIPLDKVLVVENKTTLYTTLTLPNMDRTLAIFGSGYSVSNLKSAHWLHNVQLLYWGDIDVQGFEILAQFRSYFPHTQSIFMDRATFDLYFENDPGTPTNLSSPLDLTASEQALYELLKAHNWRLEQEKIPQAYVNDFFAH